MVNNAPETGLELLGHGATSGVYDYELHKAHRGCTGRRRFGPLTAAPGRRLRSADLCRAGAPNTSRSKSARAGICAATLAMSFEASIGGVDYTDLRSVATTYGPASFDRRRRSRRDLSLGRRLRLPVQRLPPRRRHCRRLPGEFQRHARQATRHARRACAMHGHRPAARKTAPKSPPSASWPTAMSISAPMSASRPMSAPAPASAYRQLGRPERHDLLRRRQTCPDPLAVGSTSVNGGDDGWRFTYALMAGFAYDLTTNFKLDLGYKYRNIDGGDMFGWNAARRRPAPRRAGHAWRPRHARVQGRPALRTLVGLSQLDDIERRALARRFRFRCARKIVPAAT